MRPGPESITIDGKTYVQGPGGLTIWPSDQDSHIPWDQWAASLSKAGRLLEFYADKSPNDAGTMECAQQLGEIAKVCYLVQSCKRS